MAVTHTGNEFPLSEGLRVKKTKLDENPTHLLSIQLEDDNGNGLVSHTPISEIGVQDLQSVWENGNTIEQGLSHTNILQDTELGDGGYNEEYIEDGSDNWTKRYQNNYEVTLEANQNGATSYVGVNGSDGPTIYRTNDLGFQTAVKFDNPISQSEILVPSPTTGGTYTLALASDIPDTSNFVTLDTEQEITARKKFTEKIDIGNGTFSDDDSAVLINRDLTGDGGSIGFHAVRDESVYTPSGTGLRSYASYDSIPMFEGSVEAGHLHSFQARPILAGSLDLGAMRCFIANGQHNGTGILHEYYGLDITDVSGTGSVESSIGINIKPISRGSVQNYSIYSGGTAGSYFGGYIQSTGFQSDGDSNLFGKVDVRGKIVAVESGTRYNANFPFQFSSTNDFFGWKASYDNGDNGVLIGIDGDNPKIGVLVPANGLKMMPDGGLTTFGGDIVATNMPYFYTNNTTVALSSATLTSTYPLANIGSEVHALSITVGGVIYKKTATGWANILATATV